MKIDLKPNRTKLVITVLALAVWWTFRVEYTHSVCAVLDCVGPGLDCIEKQFQILPKCYCVCDTARKLFTDVITVIIFPIVAAYLGMSVKKK